MRGRRVQEGKSVAEGRFVCVNTSCLISNTALEDLASHTSLCFSL